MPLAETQQTSKQTATAHTALGPGERSALPPDTKSLHSKAEKAWMWGAT